MWNRSHNPRLAVRQTFAGGADVRPPHVHREGLQRRFLGIRQLRVVAAKLSVVRSSATNSMVERSRSQTTVVAVELKTAERRVTNHPDLLS